jgi:peptidoglycan/xylan/chitin deacetylase (PgdA/CDA1 family)
MTVAQLAQALRHDDLPPRAVALTFDDGFASAVRTAAPMLAEHDMTATVFCIAGYLGRTNDWPTQPARAPRLELASASELADLARAGFEIGAHGLEHVPLGHTSLGTAESELRAAKETLENAVGSAVSSVAYPYGVPPTGAAAAIARQTYSAACLGGGRRVRAGADPYAIPRIDVYYVRAPTLLARAVDGSLDRYLWARTIGGALRRTVRKDYARAR